MYGDNGLDHHPNHLIKTSAQPIQWSSPFEWESNFGSVGVGVRDWGFLVLWSAWRDHKVGPLVRFFPYKIV